MGPCVRKEGWEIRLADCIHSMINKRFKWGVHDCSLMSLDCIDAMCNTEIASDWRGKYTNEPEAYELLESRGGYDVIYRGYGLLPIDKNYAKRGDIAYMGGEHAIGVIIDGRICTTGLYRMEFMPLEAAYNVWSVPCHQ